MAVAPGGARPLILEDGGSGVKNDEVSPWDAAGWFSRTTFIYVLPLLKLGSKRPIQLSDLPPLPKRDDPRAIALRIERAWAAELKRPEPSLLRAILFCFSPELACSGFWTTLEYGSVLGQAAVLGPLVQAASNGSIQRGAGLGAALVFLSGMQAVSHHRAFYFSMRGGWNARNGMIDFMHSKLLRVSAAHVSRLSTGKIITVVASDVQRFDLAPWLSVLVVASVTALLTVQVGLASALAGIAVILASVALQVRLGFAFKRLRAKAAKLTDKRVRLTSELIAGALTIKSSAWEVPFVKQVGGLRWEEEAAILKSQKLKSVNSAFYFCTTSMAGAATLLVFVYGVGGTLDIARVSTVIAAIQVLRMVVGLHLARFTSGAPEARVAVARMQHILEADEVPLRDLLDPLSALMPLGSADEALLRMENASFAWALDAPSSGPSQKVADACTLDACVRRLTLVVSEGSLVMVSGPVGCGKSSLLSAILGELRVVGGTAAAAAARVGYTAQRPAIAAASVRENILFGNRFHEKAYHRAIEAAQLPADLRQLPRGDLTEIGERGLNLSGGQQARLSLARAVYVALTESGKTLLLLDDVLAAVDPAVALAMANALRSLVDETKCGIVLATHQRHLLRFADVIVEMDADGLCTTTAQAACAAAGGDAAGAGASDGSTDAPKDAMHCGAAPLVRDESDHADGVCVDYSGTFETPVDGAPVAPVDGEPVANAVDDVCVEVDLAVDSESDARAKLFDALSAPEDSKAEASSAPSKGVVSTEDRSVGAVSLRTWASYARAGGPLSVAFVAVLFIAAQLGLMAADAYVLVWAGASRQQRPAHLHSLAGLTAGTMGASLLCAVSFFRCTCAASTALHDKALFRVLAAPLAFFSSNPLGRILNRFSADVAAVDELLSVALFDFLQFALMMVSAAALAVAAIPYLALFMVPLGLIFFHLQRFTLQSMNELKRLDSISKSPVLQSFGASLQGLVTLRAFSAAEDAREAMRLGLNKSATAWFWWLSANRFLGFVLDSLCTLLLAALVCLALLLRDEVRPELLALALIYGVQLSGNFQYTIRQHALAENYMTSVERLLYYGDKLLVETDGESQAQVPALWPAQGAIEVRNVSCRYRADLPPVLRGVSVCISARSKVGVVGRTGSGKSSLLLALGRLNDVSHGAILFDGVDTATVPVAVLRNAIALIPQEPTLFSGTLRFNLDPFGAHSNAACSAALNSAQIGSLGLDSSVDEGGNNWSAGQKQLLCLARALLLQRRIVAIDEATANVDFETDAHIQDMLAKAFAKSTLVVVAHRLRTVADAHLILVFDAGKLVECGAPAGLAAIPGGAYAAMARGAAPASHQHPTLRGIARQSRQ